MVDALPYLSCARTSWQAIAKLAPSINHEAVRNPQTFACDMSSQPEDPLRDITYTMNNPKLPAPFNTSNDCGPYYSNS